MQTPEEAPPRDPQTPLFMALVALVVVPLIFLLLLLFTNLYLTVGRELGINLQRDENLIIYEAQCWREANTYRLYLVYWTSDSAPLELLYPGTELPQSPVFPVNAGINVLDIFLRDSEASCPRRVDLVDRSRQRVASAVVDR
jgi:hypothetical protein